MTINILIIGNVHANCITPSSFAFQNTKNNQLQYPIFTRTAGRDFQVSLEVSKKIFLHRYASRSYSDIIFIQLALSMLMIYGSENEQCHRTTRIYYIYVNASSQPDGSATKLLRSWPWSMKSLTPRLVSIVRLSRAFCSHYVGHRYRDDSSLQRE